MDGILGSSAAYVDAASSTGRLKVAGYAGHVPEGDTQPVGGWSSPGASIAGTWRSNREHIPDVPGYTGHVPLVHSESDNIGHTFASTNERAVVGKKTTGATPRDPTREKAKEEHPNLANERIAIQGYKGHIPGANYSVGHTFEAAKKQAIEEFASGTREGGNTHNFRRVSAPGLVEKRGEGNQVTDHIPGYKGHIPGLKSEEELHGMGWGKMNKLAKKLQYQNGRGPKPGVTPRNERSDSAPAGVRKASMSEASTTQKSDRRSPKSMEYTLDAARSQRTEGSRTERSQRSQGSMTERSQRSDGGGYTARSASNGSLTQRSQRSEGLRLTARSGSEGGLGFTARSRGTEGSRTERSIRSSESGTLTQRSQGTQRTQRSGSNGSLTVLSPGKTSSRR